MTDPAPRHSLRELAALTGTTVRTLRRWVHTGAISRTNFRGPATTYGARHLDEVRAIKRLLGQNFSLEAIRARLVALSDSDLARFVQPEPASTNVVTTAASASASEAVSPEAPRVEPPPDDPEAAGAVERWEHVTLLPGLKLLVRESSGALVQRMAQEIQERYSVAGR